MYCPECKSQTKVIDSRAMKNKNAIRRTRECINPGCRQKFKTYEDYEKSQCLMEIEILKKRITEAVGLVNVAKNILRPPTEKK